MKIAALVAGVLAAVLLCELARAAASGQQVDVVLVFATDVSASVDPDEARLQRQGMAEAFLDPQIVKTITSGALGRIAVAYLDFSTASLNSLVVDWRIVQDKDSAANFAHELLRAPRTLGVQTSISSGIEMATRMIQASGIVATRKVIDVSGDGPNNDGRRVDIVRDETVAKGIVINGIAIQTPDDQFDLYYLPDLDRYYAGCVVGGPGSFMTAAHGFADFGRAIRRKLILEISDSGARGNFVKVAAAPAKPVIPRTTYDKGCDIGERMRFNG